MPRQWTGSRLIPFANAAELADSERQFYITSVRPHRPAAKGFPEQCQFVIALDSTTGEQQKLTLSVAEDRLELERFIKEEPDNPVGPCVMVRIEAKTASGFYWVIDTIEKAPPANVKPAKTKTKKR